MLRHLKLMVVVLALVGSGCAERCIIYNRDTDYLCARSAMPITVPPGLSTKHIETHYPIPPRDYPTRYQRLSLTPPELYPCYESKSITAPCSPKPIQNMQEANSNATINTEQSPQHYAQNN